MLSALLSRITDFGGFLSYAVARILFELAEEENTNISPVNADENLTQMLVLEQQKICTEDMVSQKQDRDESHSDLLNFPNTVVH